jgi:hypothetical protein
MTIMENTSAALVVLSIYSFLLFYHICLVADCAVDYSAVLNDVTSLIYVADLPCTGHNKQRSVTFNIPREV